MNKRMIADRVKYARKEAQILIDKLDAIDSWNMRKADLMNELWDVYDIAEEIRGVTDEAFDIASRKRKID